MAGSIGYVNIPYLENVSYVDFATGVSPEFAIGRAYWDDTDDTISIDQVGGDYPVIQQVGQENQVLVRNNTDADWPNGAVVYPVGSVSYRPTGALSQANAIGTALARGIATMPIPKNTEGFVCTYGMVRGFDTQSPGWAEGDFLYLSPTVAGGLQNTPPTSGFTLWCAYVLRRHPTDGVIFFVPAPRPSFGNVAGGNYTAWDYTGTGQAFGTATCYRDELQSVTGAQITSPAGDFQQNIAEASVTAKASARYPTDYITTNWQLNHDWASGTAISPHLHWWQTEADMPNWLLAYRWQKQGAAKTTAWTEVLWSNNKSVWTTGTLNQITAFTDIAAPVGYGQLSDIVQIRLYRDVTNVSTKFGGAEASPLNQDIVNLDTHILIDMLGSHEEYTK